MNIKLKVIKSSIEKSRVTVGYVNRKNTLLSNVNFVSQVLVNGQYPCMIIDDEEVPIDCIALNASLRRFIACSVDEVVRVTSKKELDFRSINTLKIDIMILVRRKIVIDCGELKKKFISVYDGFVFSKGQTVDLYFESIHFLINISELKLAENNVSDTHIDEKDKEMLGEMENSGIVRSITKIFVTTNCDNLELENQEVNTALIDPNFSFEELGIGGLKKEFEVMLRRAFIPRICDPKTLKKLGISQTKGIVLYGPPGTGKTLIARKLGMLLNSKPPKVVNGPEILNKYVGQSEENVRALFEDAESEYKSKGDKSQLHIIIFDELDAICKTRGTDSSGVGDKVVNQLLSKIDGVDALNNILLIGMTNRIDLIDSALLRPGRLEICMEVSLPDVESRKEIFLIHTKDMRQNHLLHESVDISHLAEVTKNYTGAEIASIVRTACSYALQREVVKFDTKNKMEIDEKNILVAHDDFVAALKEVTPSFGVDESSFTVNGKCLYSTHTFDRIRDIGKECIQKLVASSYYRTGNLLLYGSPGTGKTTLAQQLALSSDFPFIKIISPVDLVGLSEQEKVSLIKSRFEDAYKSHCSIIILDDLESLIEFVSIGPRFSNYILQALKVFIREESKKKTNKMFVIGTTSQPELMAEAGITDYFSEHIYIEPITEDDYQFLSQQNPIFKTVAFESGMTIKKILSLLPPTNEEEIAE